MRTLRFTLLLLAAACGDDSASTDAAVDAIARDTAVRDTAVAEDAGIDSAIDPACGACAADGPWRCDQCMPTVIQEITAVVWQDQIAVVGGIERGGRVVGTLYLYDVDTNVWSLGPELPAGRHHVMIAVHDDNLFAFGGMRDLRFEPLASAFVLRPGEDEWAPIASMPRNRAAGFAGTVGDRIVVAAGQGEGRGDSERLEDAAPVLIYDPGADAWSEGASIGTPREHCAGVVHDGEVWIFGGRLIGLEPTFDAVDVYSLAENEWREGPPMPSAHGGFAAAALDGVAYVSGGEERDRALDTFEALDLNTEEWRTLAPVPTPRHGHAMAALGGRVFVIAGADEPVFAAVDTVESFTP